MSGENEYVASHAAEKFDTDEDHCVTIANYYKQFNTSEIYIDESEPFDKSNLKYVIAFVLLLGIMHFWSKNLMQFHNINPFEILLIRGVVSLVISFISLKINGISLTDIPRSKILLVIIGALIGALSLYGLYLSLYSLSITDAFALDFLATPVITFIDYIIFKGILRFSHFLGYICAFLGIIFLVRPSYIFEDTADIYAKSNFIYGFIAGLVSALLSGVFNGILRRIFRKVNPMLYFTYRQIAVSLLSPLAMCVFQAVVPKDTVYTTSIWLSLGGIAIIGWLSNFFMNQALIGEKLVARIYPFKFGLVVLGILADLFYFKCELIPSTYIGLALIGVNFVIAWYQLFYVTY
eukprot:TRINITY_DN6380_c0_g1_i13.p1 TRINITY_DN6380_c0_g1~~TRINITY_DN6380_c0_g1_i13.p1  ORF type:complete len:350 (+),score=60.28 TRINITY_DN6380_c0_g1_i13:148-1197(+)